MHGKDQKKVFTELCKVVEDTMKLFKTEGMPLPKATANRNCSGKIALRISPDLHKKLAIKATQGGESINRFIQHNLESSVQ